MMKSESDIDEFKVVEEIIDMLEEKRVTCGQAIRICKRMELKVALIANKSAGKAPFSR